MQHLKSKTGESVSDNNKGEEGKSIFESDELMFLSELIKQSHIEHPFMLSNGIRAK